MNGREFAVVLHALKPGAAVRRMFTATRHVHCTAAQYFGGLSTVRAVMLYILLHSPVYYYSLANCSLELIPRLRSTRPGPMLGNDVKADYRYWYLLYTCIARL